MIIATTKSLFRRRRRILKAAIYPTEPNLPPVDWQLVPIRAANVKGALDLAKQRINEAYGRRANQAAASKAS
jgi:hypothetical protein